MRTLLLGIILLVAPEASAQKRVTFAWDPPVTGPAPHGYWLALGTSPDAVATEFNAGLQTSLTVDVPVGTWYVRAYAYVDALRSGPSNELQVFVPAPVDPCVVTPLTVTVTRWPTNKWALAYTASQPIVRTSLVWRRNTVIGVLFTDNRGCQLTVLK